MSYCRWSSLNWMCDVYCYEDVSGGWTTHVASRRRIHPPTDPGPMPVGGPQADWSAWFERYKQAQAELDDIPLVPIGLSHDGESFNDPTLETFQDRLTTLRETGYTVPDYVFETIAEEIAERDALPPESDSQKAR